MSFPVTRSIVSAEALRDLVEHSHNLGAVHTCTLIGPTTNDHYLLETDRGRFILRVYCAGRRTPAEIAYELDALVHLQRCGAPVSAPVAGRDGRLSRRIDAPEGERLVALFDYAPGKPVGRELPDDRLGHLCGSVLATIHWASDDFTSPHPRAALDFDSLLDRPLLAIGPYLGDRLDDRTYLAALADRLRRRLAPVAVDLSAGFCHGDFHGWNVHLADNGSPTVFDFDCCGPGWRAYDLATFRYGLGLNPARSACWPSFLRGYTERRPLAAVDEAAIDPLVALCELWLLGGRAARVPDWGIHWLPERLERGVQFLKQWETAHLDVSAAPADRTAG